MQKPRVAIIGGGPAGLSAAFHLASDASWKEKLGSITVYQLGWRLGGKGATGRDPGRGKGFRIEEHGIHGFCSFYFNTWRMMQKVYASLDANDRALLPLKRIEDAFLGSSTAYTVESVDGCWEESARYAPYSEGDPWTDDRTSFPWTEVVLGLLRSMLRRGRRGDATALDAEDLVVPRTRARLRDAARQLHKALRGAATRFQDAVARGEAEIEVLHRELTDGLMPRRATIRRLLRVAKERRLDAHLRTLTQLDLALALLAGLVDERLWDPLFDLDRLDAVDYRAWLKHHGASPASLASASALAVPNILFAYPDGDSTRAPTLSTASWLNWMLRSVLGKGEYFYFLAAGTGETVVLPLYLFLKSQGVRFEFFHKLVGVESEMSGAERVVRRLVFERQAQVEGGSDYDPLIHVQKGEQVWAAWPNQPNWRQLRHGLENEGSVDYEEWDGRPPPKGAQPRTLEYGAKDPDGFDHIVWAIPPSMIPEVGDQGMREVWSEVVTHLPTTATQAVQLWLTRSTPELGWPTEGLEPEKARYASATFPNPLNGMVVFDDLLGFEDWPERGPRGLVYLCAQLQRVPWARTRREDEIRVRESAAASLRLLGSFLEGARPDPLRRPDAQCADFDLLYAPNGSGEARLDFQYVRANTRPTEAYVQAPPGSRLGRLDAWRTGVANVVVAGDWIYTGFNLGAFESAVTGGKLAAFALTRGFDPRQIVGYDFLHPEAAKRLHEAIRQRVIPRIP